MSDEKIYLVEAERKLEVATRNAKDAREKYIWAATRLSEKDRLKAYDDLTAARQAEKTATEQVVIVRCQEEAGIPDELDTIDLLAAADRAVNKIKDALGVDRTVYINKVLAEAHSSLTVKELDASAIRFSAFAELHRKVLTGDDGFALFANEAEAVGRAFAKQKLEKGHLVGGIELLRESRKNAMDAEELRQIDKELAEYLEEYDSVVNEEIAAVMATELPEIGKLFINDRASYIIRKAAGFQALMES